MVTGQGGCVKTIRVSMSQRPGDPSDSVLVGQKNSWWLCYRGVQRPVV